MEYLSEIKKIAKELRQNLLPTKRYDQYPLKHNLLSADLKKNTIRFVISNNGNHKISDIIKIEYNLNGIYEEFFIKNKTTINSSMVKYGEKDIYHRDSMQFKRHFFNIIPKNFKFHIILTAFY